MDSDVWRYVALNIYAVSHRRSLHQCECVCSSASVCLCAYNFLKYRNRRSTRFRAMASREPWKHRQFSLVHLICHHVHDDKLTQRQINHPKNVFLYFEFTYIYTHTNTCSTPPKSTAAAAAATSADECCCCWCWYFRPHRHIDTHTTTGIILAACDPSKSS